MTKQFDIHISSARGSWSEQTGWIDTFGAAFAEAQRLTQAHGERIGQAKATAQTYVYSARTFPAYVQCGQGIALTVYRMDRAQTEERGPDGRMRKYEATVALCYTWRGANPWGHWEDVAKRDVDGEGLLQLFERVAEAAYDMHADRGEAFTPDCIGSPECVTKRIPTIRVQLAKARANNSEFCTVLFPPGGEGAVYTSPRSASAAYFLRVQLYTESRPVPDHERARPNLRRR